MKEITQIALAVAGIATLAVILRNAQGAASLATSVFAGYGNLLGAATGFNR